MKYCASCGQCLSDNCDVCPVCGHDASDASAKPEKAYEAEKYVRSGVKYSYIKPKVTLTLIVINVLLYFVISVFGIKGGDLAGVLSMHRGAVYSGQYYRIITSVFTHRELFHLLSNCYALYIYGMLIEPAMGKWRYIAVYFTSGILGNLLTFAFMPNPSIGASGAVFGLLGAVIAIYFINPTAMNRMMMRSVISCVIITTLYSFTGGINNLAHFGGLFGGYMMSCILLTARRRRRIITSRVLMAFILVFCIVGSVFAGVNNVTDAGERQYGNHTVMSFFASMDMYREAKVFAERILSDEDSYYSADAAAVCIISGIKSGEDFEVSKKSERFITLINRGYMLTDENIYNDLKKYSSFATVSGTEG